MQSQQLLRWRPLPHCRACAGGHCVNHLTVAPNGKSFACVAGRLVTVFTLGDSPQQPPSKRVMNPLGSTVGGTMGGWTGVRSEAAGSAAYRWL